MVKGLFRNTKQNTAAGTLLPYTRKEAYIILQSQSAGKYAIINSTILFSHEEEEK